MIDFARTYNPRVVLTTSCINSSMDSSKHLVHGISILIRSSKLLVLIKMRMSLVHTRCKEAQ